MEAATITGKLKSRKIVTNEDTYDIQTSTHNFFADDILVHNSEIILRSREFCNLTEVVVRGDDTPETLKRKVKLATILGTFQSTLTNFKYLSKKWKENCEEERLLGVSLTGIMDNEYTNGTAHRDPDSPVKFYLEELLEDLRDEAVKTNKLWAAKLNIPVSAAITCVKPSGCFVKTQKIKTTIGDMSFDEIFKLNGIDLDDKKQEHREWYDVSVDLTVYDENNEEQKITKLFVNGIENTVVLTLENGEKIECTPNHKFKLFDDTWKKAEDLTENDEIMTW